MQNCEGEQNGSGSLIKRPHRPPLFTAGIRDALMSSEGGMFVRGGHLTTSKTVGDDRRLSVNAACQQQ